MCGPLIVPKPDKDVVPFLVAAPSTILLDDRFLLGVGVIMPAFRLLSASLSSSELQIVVPESGMPRKMRCLALGGKMLLTGENSSSSPVVVDATSRCGVPSLLAGRWSLPLLLALANMAFTISCRLGVSGP